MAGYPVRRSSRTPTGIVDLESLAAAMSDEVAALMLTNPNTLGLFEDHICEIGRACSTTRADWSTATAPT